MLNDHDFMRYSRQLLLEDIGPEGQLKLKQSHAVITGLGGLGSPAALYLAAAGVGELTLIDDDEVHLSNLQRQILYTEADVPDNKARTAAARLRALNPALTLNVITERQTRETLQRIVQTADIVLDCTDNMATRHAINAACVTQQKPWSAAARLVSADNFWYCSRRLNTAATAASIRMMSFRNATAALPVCSARLSG